MAVAATYTQTLDTMVSTALDTYTKDPINALTSSGEKFLTAAAQKGRVFVVNDSENVRHPILHDHGEDTSYYSPDQITGTAEVTNLGSAAVDIMTQAIFTMQAATRNINLPQSQPPGNLIDYVSSVVKANMMSILNQEEVHFITGALAAGTASPVMFGACSTDVSGGGAAFSAGRPVNLPAILFGSSATALNSASDWSSGTFAGVETDNTAAWQPNIGAEASQVLTGATDATVFGALQKAILESSYSETERPTDVYTTLGMFERILLLLRSSAALPDPVRTNLGKEGTISFGGVTIDWSRYLVDDAGWSEGLAAASTTYHPMLGVNWNSLRLNTVRAGGVNSDSLGFIRQIGDLQAHPLKTNLFKRIEWKRQWSVDGGRRSFFTLNHHTVSG
jgi:hypothetical protein